VETGNLINAMARIIGHCEHGRRPDESDWIQWLEINAVLNLINSDAFHTKHAECNRLLVGFMASEARLRSTGEAGAEVLRFAGACPKCGAIPLTAVVLQDSPNATTSMSRSSVRWRCRKCA
jgi:hypothetical protein